MFILSSFIWAVLVYEFSGVVYTLATFAQPQPTDTAIKGVDLIEKMSVPLTYYGGQLALGLMVSIKLSKNRYRHCNVRCPRS